MILVQFQRSLTMPYFNLDCRVHGRCTEKQRFGNPSIWGWKQFVLSEWQTMTLVRNLVSQLRDGHRLRMFQSRVLRGTFAPKGEEGTGGKRKLCMRSFMICTLWQILLWQYKSKRIRRTGHAARKVWIRIGYKTMIRKFEGKGHLEDLGIDGRILLQCIISIWWSGFSPVMVSCEHGNVPSRRGIL
jgi:hypothetical protein